MLAIHMIAGLSLSLFVLHSFFVLVSFIFKKKKAKTWRKWSERQSLILLSVYNCVYMYFVFTLWRSILWFISGQSAHSDNQVSNDKRITRLSQISKSCSTTSIMFNVIIWTPLESLIKHLCRFKYSALLPSLQLVLALRYIHKEKRIVHRDLKPANVMLDDNDHVTISTRNITEKMSCQILPKTWH